MDDRCRLFCSLHVAAPSDDGPCQLCTAKSVQLKKSGFKCNAQYITNTGAQCSAGVMNISGGILQSVARIS